MAKKILDYPLIQTATLTKGDERITVQFHIVSMNIMTVNGQRQNEPRSIIAFAKSMARKGWKVNK